MGKATERVQNEKATPTMGGVFKRAKMLSITFKREGERERGRKTRVCCTISFDLIFTIYFACDL